MGHSPLNASADLLYGDLWYQSFMSSNNQHREQNPRVLQAV